MSRLFVYDENMTDERAKITVAKMAAVSDIVAPVKEYWIYPKGFMGSYRYGNAVTPGHVGIFRHSLCGV